MHAGMGVGFACNCSQKQKATRFQINETVVFSMFSCSNISVKMQILPIVPVFTSIFQVFAFMQVWVLVLLAIVARSRLKHVFRSIEKVVFFSV